MELVVERLSAYAAEIGLTREDLQAARLYTENPERAGSAYLYLRVNEAVCGSVPARR